MSRACGGGKSGRKRRCANKDYGDAAGAGVMPGLVGGLNRTERKGGDGALGKSDPGMEHGCVFNGLGPDDASGAFQLGDGAVGVHRELDEGVGGQGAAGGKANAVVAEVNGPGVVVPLAGELVAAGDFGKAEVVVAGDANRAAAIDRLACVFANMSVTAGEQLILPARGVMTGGAVRGNMLLYGQNQPIFDQQTGSAAG